jgi:hypothetical protein
MIENAKSFGQESGRNRFKPWNRKWQRAVVLVIIKSGFESFLKDFSSVTVSKVRNFTSFLTCKYTLYVCVCVCVRVRARVCVRYVMAAIERNVKGSERKTVLVKCL